MTISSRRSFVAAVIAALAGGGAAAASVASASEALDGVDVLSDDVGRLCRAIELGGAELAASIMVRLANAGQFSGEATLREVNRHRRRDYRARKAAKRRERHGGDEVLYRGPLRIGPLNLDGTRDVRSEVTRRRLLIGQTDREITISGIGIPFESRNIERPVPDCHGLESEYVDDMDREQRCRAVTVPAGSRIVVDMRRGLCEVMACEVIRTDRGQHRIHLWVGATGRETSDETPRVAGGVIYESPTTREIGLLGLPL